MEAPCNPEIWTHVYESVHDGLDLTIDIVRPPKLSTPGSYEVANSLSWWISSELKLVFHYCIMRGIISSQYLTASLELQMIGEKTIFPPSWLINACMHRSWTYITLCYCLLPESSGCDIISDALYAANWAMAKVTEHLILAGSSAGGYLALSVATRLTTPKPLAVLSV